MSIDLRVDFAGAFNVGSWIRRTDEILALLAGRRYGDVEARIDPNVHMAWDDVSVRETRWSYDLDRWDCGPHSPGHFFELRVRGTAFATAGTIPAGPDSTEAFFEVTTARTAASLLLSAANAISTAELGQGTFQDWGCSKIGADTTTSAGELLARLRIAETEFPTLEEAARALLRNTGFRDWGALYGPIEQPGPEEWPGVWAPWPHSEPSRDIEPR